MNLRLTLDEFLVLRRGVTLFVFVPFRPGKKFQLSKEDRDVLARVDRVAEDVAAARRANSPPTMVEVELAPGEIRVLRRVIEADIEQCGTGDDEITLSEYRIHFAVERKAVEAVRAKLIACEGPD